MNHLAAITFCSRYTAARFFASCVLAALLVAGFAGVAYGVAYMPDVTKPMAKASYWVEKQQDVDQVLADWETIDGLNVAGVDADGTGLQPLELASGNYYDAQKQNTLKNSAASEFAAMLASLDEEAVYRADWTLIDQAYADEILANYPTDGVAPNIASPYAIVTTHTAMRSYPTDDPILYTKGDYDDNNLYISALRVNEPVIIRAQSVDKRFYLCISSCINAAWVPAEDLAICASKEQWLEAWKISPGQELVVTGYKVRTEQSNVTTNTANRMLYMGTVLERIDLASPADALEIVGTRSAYNNHVCYLPVRDQNGNYSKEMALIAESADVSEGYLPLTTKGVANEAFKSLGQMYGWGGMLEANDCSGYVRDVYKTFGLELARNTTWQMALPVRTYDLQDMDPEHKAAAIAQMPLGTVLFWGSHEMIYLGQENGKLYVISSLGGVGDLYGDSNNTYQVKGVTINTLDMVRGNKMTWLQTLTCANIPYIPDSVAGPGLFDIAFYENAATWPEESAMYTGEPIEPEVTIPGLTKEVDYTVSFENNTDAGTATVKITGQGNYSGEISHPFEILPPSLKKATVTVPDQEFTGEPCEPEPTVVLAGITLKAGEDYEVSYSNNIEPGTATVKVTGKGSFEDSASGTFKIGRGSLEKATVTVDDQLYTGKELKPAPVVKLGDIELDPYSDYRVAYKDNVELGTATVTVTGKGDYVGSASATFEIVQASVDDATIRVRDQVYTGKAIEPEPLVSIGSTILEQGAAYEVSYENNVEVGTATITITGIGSFSGTATKTFEIVSTSLTKANVTVADQTYTGSALKPKPTVKMGDITLKEGTDYSVSYTDNVSTGTAIVTVEGKGNFTDSTFKTFKIGKASQSIKAKNVTKKYTAAKSIKKLGVAKTINLKKKAKVSAKTEVKFKKANKAGGSKIIVAKDGTVTVKNGLKRGTYKVKVRLTASADANYKKAANKNITLKIVVK